MFNFGIIIFKHKVMKDNWEDSNFKSEKITISHFANF